MDELKTRSNNNTIQLRRTERTERTIIKLKQDKTTKNENNYDNSKRINLINFNSVLQELKIKHNTNL